MRRVGRRCGDRDPRGRGRRAGDAPAVLDRAAANANSGMSLYGGRLFARDEMAEDFSVLLSDVSCSLVFIMFSFFFFFFLWFDAFYYASGVCARVCVRVRLRCLLCCFFVLSFVFCLLFFRCRVIVFRRFTLYLPYGRWAFTNRTYYNVAILPVVTRDLQISHPFSPYDFLSRSKFCTLTTCQTMVGFYLTHVLMLSDIRKNTNSGFHKNRTNSSRCTWLPTINRPLGRLAST